MSTDITDVTLMIRIDVSFLPGEWFFHCHLLFHSELGMGLIFGVGNHSDLPPVPPYFPRCGNYADGSFYKQLQLSPSSSIRPSFYNVGVAFIAIMSIVFRS